MLIKSNLATFRILKWICNCLCQMGPRSWQQPFRLAMRVAEQLGPSRVTERRKTGAGVVEGGGGVTWLQKYIAAKIFGAKVEGNGLRQNTTRGIFF